MSGSSATAASVHPGIQAGGLPGVSSVMTLYLERKMEKLDIPPIPEFIEMIADTGAGLYACKASAPAMRPLDRLGNSLGLGLRRLPVTMPSPQ